MTIEQINHTGTICDEIFKERVLQEEKWVQQSLTSAQFAVILHEEVGQVANEICKAERADSENDRFAQWENLRNELIKVAALAVAMVESLDRNELQSSFPFKFASQESATDIWVIESPIQR